MFTILLVNTLGCRSPFTEEIVAGTRHLSADLTTGLNGLTTVDVPVLDGETALLATVRVNSPLSAHVRALEDPDGVQVFDAIEWNDSPYNKTNGGFVSDTTSLNWPVQGGDLGLIGGKWPLTIGVVDASFAYLPAAFTLDVFLKADTSFEDAALEVSIVYADDVKDDVDLHDAVDVAKGIWTDLYDSIGISVSFTNYVYTEGALGAPAFGDETAYTEIASQTEPRSVIVVFTENILEPELQGVFGNAGAIPGPLVPSPRSAVQISGVLAAGTDGEFSAEETRLLAETMAHEVGHYLGLFHPVDGDKDTDVWATWDFLDDTPQCESQSECEGVLGSNLMFAYPICGFSACTPQDEITDGQAGVAHRYVGAQ